MASNKKIVEHVSNWLRVYDDGTVDRTWTSPSPVQLLVNSVPPHDEFIEGVAVRDVVIDPSSGLTVRIYVPERDNIVSGKEKLPLLLHFHGGGFCVTQPDWYMYYQFYTRLVHSVQAVCVSVYLRLAPEHRLPAACEDAYAAFLWLCSVARGELSELWLNNLADFQRVFLIGDSTGGNLVHYLAARAGDMNTEPVRLAGGIAIHPGFLRAELSKSFHELPETPLLTRDMVNKFMSLALPDGATKDFPITCPMGPLAPPLDDMKLPPMLVAVAEMDLIRDSELEYCEAMKEAGKEVEILVNHGMGHCFYLDPQTTTQTNKLIEEIVNFIVKH
ncbi:hypothetical protein EZV62_005185 [Acer yangbiense]|uniref:Alpha/beta hydrolase fold-3 domain-containing protein n=1 Tax=Acer yangbiense TaxID=1000413 RepID=A0A5C7IM52_9ROSI|nr:hypothetical protein EZV62_005185 [Acer yangbiense]